MIKLRYPKGIPGGILKYGFNIPAIFHAWFAVFAVNDARRMQAKREARLKREAETAESEREAHEQEEDDESKHQ